MKKIIKIALLVLPLSLFAQKFNQINHGTTYNQIKDVSSKVFKKDCEGFISGSRYRFPYMFTAAPIGTVNGYATSQFEGELKNKSEKLWLEYNRKLESLGNEFDNYKMRYLYSDFNDCSQKAYDYLQLHLKKFEANAEYYKNQYNYEYDLKSQNDEISNKIEFLKDSISIVKNEMKLEIKNDKILTDLKTKKETDLTALKNKYKENSISNLDDFENRISSVKNKYDRKVEGLNIERTAEFKKLSPDNYNNNKQKIVKEYEPRFERLRIDKNKEIQEIKDKNSNFISNQKSENDSKSDGYRNEVSKLELSIEKQIFERENELMKTKEKQFKELDDLESNKSSKIRKETKGKYNLEGKLEKHENDYNNDIQKINEDIKTVIAKKDVGKNIKKSAKKLFGF